MKSFDKGALKAESSSSRYRTKEGRFLDVEECLMEFIRLRQQKYSRNKAGLTWSTLMDRTRQIACRILPAGHEFKASSGWLTNVLRRNNIVGIGERGRAYGLTSKDEAESRMKCFQAELDVRRATRQILMDSWEDDGGCTSSIVCFPPVASFG